jgi:hypothetical protein
VTVNEPGPATAHQKESPAARKRTRRDAPRLRFIAALGLLTALGCLMFLLLPALLGMGGGSVQSGGSPPVASAPPSSTNYGTAPESPAAPLTPDLPPATPAWPPAAPPQRLVYPSADIDVVVHPLDPSADDKERQTIIPPPTMDGYWLTPYGAPGAGSTNTTYVVGHSWQDREAPFNRLSSRASAGDLLTVATGTGELGYRVDSVTTYEKSGLKDSAIWDVAPNRLVLISCYTDDLWGTNVVVVASPVY